jgi:RNA polymerase sigma factor (sigma-70 family)
MSDNRHNLGLTNEDHEGLVRFVWYIARRMQPVNRGELDEFVSAGLVGLARAIQSYRSERGSLTTWIYHCVKNAILACREAEVRAHRMVSIEQIQEEDHRVLADPDLRVWFEDQPSGRNWMLWLTRRQRQVMHLRYWRGLKQKQVASILGVTHQAVSQYEKAARKIIRDRLEWEAA